MPDGADFPIVGIGASAGGLEAYKRVLASLPVDSGAAFILVQHLDPNHESMMADLLGRHTSMTVHQAENDMALEPDTVYVIPPGKFIRLIDHGLFLDEPVQERGIRLAIDYFFRSLAEVRGEKAIGIILSGTGSDGTLGLREIKAAGGMIMVQDPTEAEYDGMPRSAVATGLVDVVTQADQIGTRLVQFLAHPYLDRSEEETGLLDTAPDAFRSILSILKMQTDYDFQSYKKGTVERRIERRMGIRQLKSLDDYVRYLRGSPEEVNLLFRDLLIGVTRFFREPEAWDVLAERVIDPMLLGKPDGGIVRAWVPGCATGEEAYTLAMVIFDRIDRLNREMELQLFATDLNDGAIETARAGRYPASVAGDIPERIRAKFLTEDGESLRVSKRLRETVVFATQNVISDPPFSKLDIITCRNLMIYLESDVQDRMIEMFHFALSPNGHLFLGNSESAERPGRIFEPIDKPNRIYRRTDVVRPATGRFPVVPSARGGRGEHTKISPAGPQLSPIELAKKQMMNRFVPASVVVNRSFDVLYYHGPMRDYLDFPAGEPTNNLMEMALDGLRGKLRTVLNGLISGKHKAEIEAHQIHRANMEVSVRISGETLTVPQESEPLYVIHFADLAPPEDAEEARRAREQAREGATPEERSHVSALEYELQSTREDLQSTIEEMETANEELKASNEEVMSMNEELQSTNEELETSREELQSLNEELSTVNSQLEEKVHEVENANNDLFNLLRSTNIAVIFLDTDMMIRRFTPAIQDIMRIIDTDVGRPVDDIALRVRDAALLDDARRCLRDLSELEAEVESDGGRHLIRRLRPYRTSENRIDGVVITYTDVTNLQEATESAKRREAQQASVAELGRMALGDTTLDELLERSVEELGRNMNVRFAKVLQLAPDRESLLVRTGIGWTPGTVGHTHVEIGSNSQAGFTLMHAHPIVVEDFAKEKRFSPARILRDHNITCGASVTIGPTSAPWGVLGVHETEIGRCGFTVDDVNYLLGVANVLWLSIAREREISRIQDETRRLRELTDALPAEVSIVDRQLRFELLNAAHEVYGIDPAGMIGAPLSDVIGDDAAAELADAFETVLKGEECTRELALTQPDTGTKRHLIVNQVPRRADDGTVDGVITVAIDITERRKLEEEAERSTRLYRTIGEAIPYGVWICDAAGKLVYVSQSFLDLVGMTSEEALTLGWTRALKPGLEAATIEAWDECRRTECDWEYEHEFVAADGSTAHILSLGRPVRGRDGKVENWVGLNLDITERKEEEQRMAVVSAELDHRVKNILATVSTIARMTGRSAQSLDEYRLGLEARLQALAAAHQILAESNWTGMELEPLLRLELGAYMDGGSDVNLDGPRIKLTPRAAQTLALAFHELTTNAAKHGALSTDDGRLDVSWSLGSTPEEGSVLSLSWTETSSAEIDGEPGDGFGSTVLTRVLPSQLGAKSEMTFGKKGITFQMSLSDSSLV